MSVDEFKAFIAHVQEVEQENIALKSENLVLRESLTDTRERVRTLELLVETRDREIKLYFDENVLLRRQADEYKFLYEHTKPSAFETATSKIGIGAGVAAVLYFIIQAVN